MEGGRSADNLNSTSGYGDDDYGASCAGDACAYGNNDMDHHIYRNKSDSGHNDGVNDACNNAHEHAPGGLH
jgi:hypothetical protein